MQSFDAATLLVEETLQYTNGATPIGPIVAWGASGVAYRERVGPAGSERIRLVVLPDLSAGPPPVRNYDIAAYFPLQMGTTWTYENQDGKKFRRRLLPKTKTQRGREVVQF